MKRNYRKIPSPHEYHFYETYSKTNLIISNKYFGHVITKDETDDEDLVGWMVYFPPIILNTEITISEFAKENYYIYSNLRKDPDLDTIEEVKQEKAKRRLVYIHPVNFGVLVPTNQVQNPSLYEHLFNSPEEVKEVDDFYDYRMVLNMQGKKFIKPSLEIIEYAFVRVLLFEMGNNLPEGDLRRCVTIHDLRLPLYPPEMGDWQYIHKDEIDFHFRNKHERVRERQAAKDAVVKKHEEVKKFLSQVEEIKKHPYVPPKKETKITSFFQKATNSDNQVTTKTKNHELKRRKK